MRSDDGGVRHYEDTGDKCLIIPTFLLDIIALSLSLGMFSIDLVPKMPISCVHAKICAVGVKEVRLEKIRARMEQNGSIHRDTRNSTLSYLDLVP